MSADGRSGRPGIGRATGHASRITALTVAVNLYMRRFVLGWKSLGYESRLEAHIVSYADDLVICCANRPKRRCGTAAAARG